MASEPGATPGGQGNPPYPDLGKHLDTATSLALERTELAHERTLMGWVRTCFSIIGFGLSIFTFFLTVESHEKTGKMPPHPKTLCMILLAGGTVFMALASMQHYLSLKRLSKSGMEKRFSLSMFIAVLVIAAGASGFFYILMGY